MWVSIAAWLVTVMSSLFRLECDLGSSSRLGTFRLGLVDASVFLRRDSWGQGSDKVLRFEPYSLRHWPAKPSIERWSFEGASISGSGMLVWVPAWYLTVVPTLVLFILHRRDRRFAHRLKHNLCTRCGYSRAGIAEGAKCPECGGDPANTRT